MTPQLDWEEWFSYRWESLLSWARILTFPLFLFFATLFFVFHLLASVLFLCLLPFILIFGWRLWPERPIEEITLEEMRTRAEQISACFKKYAEQTPDCLDVLEPGLVFSRHMTQILNRSDCSPELVHHYATRTRKHMRYWKGLPYFALQELASDAIRWSEHQKTV